MVTRVFFDRHLPVPGCNWVDQVTADKVDIRYRADIDAVEFTHPKRPGETLTVALGRCVVQSNGPLPVSDARGLFPAVDARSAKKAKGEE